MSRLPWVLEEGARAGLRQLGVTVDDAAGLRSLLETELSRLPPGAQVERAFAWLLGRTPDEDALRFHLEGMARSAHGTRWLLDCLLAIAPGESFAGERDLARRVLGEAETLDDAGFVELAFRRVLGRDPEEAAASSYAGRLAAGLLNRPHLLQELFGSEELRRAPAAPSMAAAWDARAGEDALFYIASGASASEEEFRRSGERELEEVVLNGLAVDADARIVEIGCGIGRLLVPLAGRAGTVHGVDISAAMIERSRAYCAGLPNVSSSVTDGTLGAIPDASTDLVFSFIVFQHIPEERAIETYLHEAARVLVPGGVLRFQVDGRWRLCRTADTYDGVKLSGPRLRAMVAAAGLSLRGEWGEETHYYWADARAPGAPSARVRLLPRRLDVELLTSLLKKARVAGAESLSSAVAAGERSLRSALGLALETLPTEPLAFVRETFALLLDRAPSPEEEVFHTRPLERGWADRDALFDSLMTCGPFRDRVEPCFGEPGPGSPSPSTSEDIRR